MKITITINGKPMSFTITNENWEKVKTLLNVIPTKKESKKTGYESPKEKDIFYFSDNNGHMGYKEYDPAKDYPQKEIGNCYTNSHVACQNTCADTLISKLRHFAATNGGCVTGKYNQIIDGYEIVYDRYKKRLVTSKVRKDYFSTFGSIVFITEEAAQKAIKEFDTELTWYFTAYTPMPYEWWGCS